jgi:hypothetical protein
LGHEGQPGKGGRSRCCVRGSVGTSEGWQKSSRGARHSPRAVRCDCSVAASSDSTPKKGGQKSRRGRRRPAMAGAESSRPITSGSHCLALRELVRAVRRGPLRLLGPHELLLVYHSPISLSLVLPGQNATEACGWYAGSGCGRRPGPSLATMRSTRSIFDLVDAVPRTYDLLLAVSGKLCAVSASP